MVDGVFLDVVHDELHRVLAVGNARVKQLEGFVDHIQLVNYLVKAVLHFRLELAIVNLGKCASLYM